MKTYFVGLNIILEAQSGEADHYFTTLRVEAEDREALAQVVRGIAWELGADAMIATAREVDLSVCD